MLRKNVADDSLFFLLLFSEKIRIENSCELSIMEMIHMNCQALFSLKKQ